MNGLQLRVQKIHGDANSMGHEVKQLKMDMASGSFFPLDIGAKLDDLEEQQKQIQDQLGASEAYIYNRNVFKSTSDVKKFLCAELATVKVSLGTDTFGFISDCDKVTSGLRTGMKSMPTPTRLATLHWTPRLSGIRKLKPFPACLPRIQKSLKLCLLMRVLGKCSRHLTSFLELESALCLQKPQ